MKKKFFSAYIYTYNPVSLGIIPQHGYFVYAREYR